MPDHRPGSKSDDHTPPLFGDEDRAPARESDGDDAAGLEGLVTRLPDRPRHWAMKWRPADREVEDDREADRHPARIRDDEDGETPSLVIVDPDPAGAVPPDSSTPPQPGPEDSTTPVDEAAAAAVMTSRTWSSPDEGERRHPVTPSGVGSTSGATVPPRHALPAGPRSSRFGGTAAAGWLVAIAIGLAWMVFGGSAGVDSEGMEPAGGDPTGEVVFARPAGEAFEANLAREEIASLRQERSRLMQEVEAARILLEDHRRLTASLAESTATNEGAALELGVLEGDAARWRHRHAVAMARLDELATLLLEVEAREATLAGELVDTQRRLDALDAVNRDD